VTSNTSSCSRSSTNAAISRALSEVEQEELNELCAFEKCVRIRQRNIERVFRGDVMREQIADVLQDFATVLIEEISCLYDLDIDEECAIMDRLNGVIQAFRDNDASVYDRGTSRGNICRKGDDE